METVTYPSRRFPKIAAGNGGPSAQTCKASFVALRWSFNLLEAQSEGTQHQPNYYERQVMFSEYSSGLDPAPAKKMKFVRLLESLLN
uniref:Uncharacterized protein n=1 Tax=Daphnia galeata TaxID=27404 RepID=A0A8J2WTH2_9CRUS|nr:unnamed protein product [Daphnia galeata]